MNTYQDLDVKLKALIILSKSNNDARRAAVVFYLLIRRVINEKGIKLGFVPLISKSERKAHEYMNAINNVMENSFKFKIFDDQIIEKVKKYELLYLRNPSSFKFSALKEIVNIYYDLRKMKVPNVFQTIKELELRGTSRTLNKYKFLANENEGRLGILFKKNQQDHVKSYLTLDLENKVASIQKKLRKCYDKESFEQLIEYKRIKRELNQNSHRKIPFKGLLKDNPYYQHQLYETPGFFLLGFCLVLLMVSIVFFIQDIMNPEISGTFTLISFLLFGLALLVAFIYWKLFYMEARRL